MSERPKTDGEQDNQTELANGPDTTPTPTIDGKGAEEVNTEADSAPPAPRKKRTGLYLGTTAVVLIAALAGYATLPLWKGSLPQALQPYAEALLPPLGDSAELTAVKAEVTALEASLRSALADLDHRLSALERAPVPAAAAPSEDASGQDVSSRLGALEAALTRLQEAPATEAPAPVDLSPLQTDLATLRERLGDVEASRAPASAVLSLSERVSQVEDLARASTSRQDRALAFLLAVGQLREAVESGRPFDAELRTLHAVTPPDYDTHAPVNGFQAESGNGLPTLLTLRQSLQTLTPAALRATLIPDDEGGWWSGTLDRLLSVVSIQRIDGEAENTSPAAALARAEAHLAAGALASAIAEVETLEGPAAETMAPWLHLAWARAAADTGLSELVAEALARVGADSLGARANPPTASPAPVPAPAPAPEAVDPAPEADVPVSPDQEG